MTREVSKRLTANDLGITGGHMAGIHIPKDPPVLSFFPQLDTSIKNPRAKLILHEKCDGARWEFNYVYYNNKRFGGTRDEYRLTGMTRFLRMIAAKPGDELVFTKTQSRFLEIAIRRARDTANSVSDGDGLGVLVLSGGWKLVSY
jgi:hypothetical protein